MWSEKCAPNARLFGSGLGWRLSSGHSVISRSLKRNVEDEYRKAALQVTNTVILTIGVGERGQGAVAPPRPNSGEKVFYGQTSCNIRAVDIFLEEARTGTLYF